MRVLLGGSMLLAVTGLAWSQAMTDAAGIVAGGTVGGVAGKKVSQGLTAVLDKTNTTTATAAKTEKGAKVEKPVEKGSGLPAGQSAGKTKETATVLQVSPGGVVKDHSLVPPPPPRKVAAVPPPPPLAFSAPAMSMPAFAPPPPPRQATPDDLRMLAGGTARAEVLKLGAPSARITMMDDGHLVEIFRYQTRDTTVGVVRLSDGSVSNVQVH